MSLVLSVEIKARCADPCELRRRLVDLGAVEQGEDHQVDTYFRVPEGRLKLRAGRIENSLIYYRRPDQPGPKDSHVELCTLDPGSAASIRDVLTLALGVLTGQVVDRG